MRKTAAALLGELWADDAARPALTRAAFESVSSRTDRRGRCVRVGAQSRARPTEILARFDQMNLSTYLFRAPVLYEALQPAENRPARERGVSHRCVCDPRRRRTTRPAWWAVKSPTPRDMMAFNNPQELLAIEEVYRQQAGAARPSSRAFARPASRCAPLHAWENLLNDPSPAARRQFRQWYGDEVPWAGIRRVVRRFGQRYGADRPVAIIRSPGRINLLGRHIDHQGGTVNVMAINREIVLVAAPRTDDHVSLANTDDAQFAEQDLPHLRPGGQPELGRLAAGD